MAGSRIFWIVFTLLSAVYLLPGQDYQFLVTIEQKTDFIQTDKLGNIYLIRGSQVSKYNPDGELAGRYSNLSLGSIYQVDAGDPLRLLLYYKDFNKLVFLDRFLAELREPVSLDDLGMMQASAVCHSSRNGFWVYNSFTNRLYHFNEYLVQTLASPVLTGLDESRAEQLGMHEVNENLFLFICDHEIRVFDLYGNYRYNMDGKGIVDCQFREGGILFMRGNKLFMFSLDTDLETVLPLCCEGSRMVRLEAGRLYCLGKDQVNIYKILD